MLDVSDFNDFDLFSIVAAEGSLRRAALRLGMTQQLVSRRLSRLERELDQTLVQRSTSGIQLTAAGERLIPYIRETVRLMNEGVAAVREVATNGSLSMSSDAALAPLVVPFVANVLRGTSIGLSNQLASAADSMRAAAEGDVDVAFVPRGQLIDGLGAEWLFDDELWVVASPDHPLASSPGISPTDLTEHAVAVDSEGASGALARDHLAVNGHVRELLHDVGSASCVLALAAAGTHVGITPLSVLARSIERPYLIDLDVSDWPGWSVSIDFVFRDVDRERGPVLALLNAAQATHSLDDVLDPPGGGLWYRH